MQSFQEYCVGYDLYVADNGSRDGDLDYLSTYRSDMRQIAMLGGNYLFTYAVNYLLFLVDLDNTRDDGCQLCHDQVIIANPDIEFREGWDRDLGKNKGIMGFTLVKPNGFIEHAGGLGDGNHIGRGEQDEGQYAGVREVDWVTFGAVALHKEAIATLGDLDERFPHFGSDREYCAKARKAGIPVKCSGARLTHGFGKSTRPYEWRDIPDEIWEAHVKERERSGVVFPKDQGNMPRIDAPGKYMSFRR
jgi:GT2 family glycosyltransferase